MGSSWTATSTWRNAENSRSSRAKAEATKRQRGVHLHLKRDHRGRFEIGHC